MISTIRKMLGSRDAQPSASDLDRALVEIDARLAKARAALLAAEAQRGDALLDGDASAARNRADRAAAIDEIADLQAARPAIVARLGAATIAEADAARHAAYAKAKAAAKAATNEIRRRYPELSRELLELVRKSELARAAVEQANANLPVDATPIDLPEAFRDIAAEPEKLIRTDVVERWFARPEFGGHAVDPATAKGFVDLGDGTAEFIARTYAGHEVTALAMKVVEKTETILAWRGEVSAEPLRSLTLPALYAGAEGFALKGWGHAAEDVIGAIDRALSGRVEAREARIPTHRKTSQAFGGHRNGGTAYQTPRINGPAPLDPAVPPAAGKSGRVSSYVNPAQQRTGGQNV